MTDKPTSLSNAPQGYADWLADVKGRIHAAQQRAALAVNRELVQLYWQIGRDILQRQAEQGWGAKVIERLAHDLRTAFPNMKGFSRANLMYMRAFAEAWPDTEIVQQAVGQLRFEEHGRHRTGNGATTRSGAVCSRDDASAAATITTDRNPGGLKITPEVGERSAAP